MNINENNGHLELNPEYEPNVVMYKNIVHSRSDVHLEWNSRDAMPLHELASIRALPNVYILLQ